MNITYEQLNQGQKDAYNEIINILETPGKHVTLNGYAGTGKTTLTKLILEYLRNKGVEGVQLAAPTHQAKKILSELAGAEASTIHSLLKINPTTYEDVAMFEQSDQPDLSECRVLICDEASMYDKKLFEILMASVPSWCSIIALGDIAQIRPVSPNSNIPEVSLFFLNPKFKQLSLTEVMRSNAPIIEVATEVRQGEWIRECVIDDSGVFDLSKGQKPLVEFMQKYFSIVKTPEDLLNNRMLAFTNASVDNLNKIIRKQIYKTTVPFINDEIIVLQEPVFKTHTFENKTFTEVKFNNSELIRIVEATATSKRLRINGVVAEDTISCWMLKCKSIETDVIETITVIEDKAQLNIFNNFMAAAASEFKDMKNSGKRPNWKAWWALKNSFTKVKALPCGTIHKSQGTSVDNVFLYTPCIHKTDLEMAQQLLYVGLTRARHNAYFV